MEFVERKIRSLKISILGDSISTFEGFNPFGFEVFYKDNKLKENDLVVVKQTWWMRVIDALHGELCVNNSYSSSFVYEMCEFSISAEQRCCALHNNQEPNWILVYAGTNDCLAQINADKFYDYYVKMLSRIEKRYPQARIFCATLLFGGQEKTQMTSKDYSLLLPYNDAIKKAVDTQQVNLVDLAKYNKYYQSLDGVHPNKEGHKLLADLWLHDLKQLVSMNKRFYCDIPQAAGRKEGESLTE